MIFDIFKRKPKRAVETIVDGRRVYPCKAATLEELWPIVPRIGSKLSDESKRFVSVTCTIDPHQIHWAQIRGLFIVGSSDAERNKILKEAGLGPGAYINRSGDGLVLIHPDEGEVQSYIDHRGDGLEVLMVCYTALSALNLSTLGALDRLSFRYNELLSELPGLEKLTQLTRLNLSGCVGLTELPGLGNLNRLTELYLNGCESLDALPGLDNLKQLSVLSLYDCKGFRLLPEEISGLENLRRLDLSYMSLRTLPDWLPEIAEEFSRDLVRWERGKSKGVVRLYRTTVEDMKDDMSIFRQPYEVVAEFFRKRSRGEVGLLNEIKVVFLGDGEAGKSHTIARLMSDGGEPEDYTDQSTPGIVIKHKEYTRNGRTFRVNYWDFGGQEIMHSMHRIFLTGRTMYVVLLNARDDTQGERAKYWLHNIKSFAPDAPVLLVLNKIDQNPKASVDEKDLRGRYQKLTGVVPLSARDFSRERFMEEFTDVLLREIEETGYLNAQWPNNWAAVKGRLENMETHYIMGSDYREICRECQVDKNQKELLHWFNDLGVSFCCDGEDDYTLEDYVILRPDWITNALYILLFNPLENAENGLIPHKSIYQILRNAHDDPAVRCTLPEARYDAGDIGYVLGIMRKFGLSFTDGHGNEFIPMLCQQESTVDVQSFHNDEEILEFNMEFDYLPNNLLHRMMVERSGELDLENVWRTGTKFRYPELGYSAVVVSDSRVLRFFIRSKDPMHRPNTYLTMLKAHVDRIVEGMGIAKPVCKLIYKLDGKRDEFDYENVKLSRELGNTTMVSTAHRRNILIEDILNQSAPDGVEDEKLLLDTIVSSCLHIQQEPDYHLKDGEAGRGMEDKRNRRVRDDLELRGFKVKDQTQRGLSGSGRGVGELDLLICSGEKMAMPWTIIEALRVSGGAKTEWEAHLNKLLENYNYFGAPCVYLLTYVDDDGTRFPKIWDSYLERIPKVHPGKFKFVPGFLREVKDASRGNSIKVARCRYEKGGEMTNAYHIFVQIPKRKK